MGRAHWRAVAQWRRVIGGRTLATARFLPSALPCTSALRFAPTAGSELAAGVTGERMGGTAALVAALNLSPYLRTALISSGVAFAGYGPLVAWYIPHRWIDYLLGCALALLSGLLLFPNSALSRYRQLLERSDPSAREALARLYPAAREEASWLGQQLPAPP